ncbi:hypothetical protein I9W82_002105 [Candida metapsilosis]|uniref:Inositol oxygenase n=1 Tax=Candida metapsilosis TaxID=273372 RepID=A0A8H7ZII5_9ASCO|nr:hypothetical protein I9W82_002105 [Candida metapsilosis]
MIKGSTATLPSHTMSRISKSIGSSTYDQHNSKSISEKLERQLLEHLDDDVLNVNVLRSNLKAQAAKATEEANMDNHSSSSLSKETITPTIEQEILLQEKSDELADENWHIATEYYKNIDTKAFRQYELACDRVKSFYEEQHAKQTVAYNIQARINFKTKTRDTMTVWQALEKLNKLLDESDPDTELSQISHALQTAEAIRRDGKPRWFQLVGLIHDLGKLLYFYDSRGQWDVVGDTFPVGCKFSKRIIFPDSFKANPDFLNPLYNTKYGIYSKHCGLDKVMLSWGHDEYMFHIAKKYSKLPKEGLAMIRYHSFYPWHQEMAYTYLMDDHDKEMLKAVKAFNQYDLYSKIDREYDVEELKPYYLELIDEFFPDKVIDF